MGFSQDVFHISPFFYHVPFQLLCYKQNSQSMVLKNSVDLQNTSEVWQKVSTIFIVTLRQYLFFVCWARRGEGPFSYFWEWIYKCSKSICWRDPPSLLGHVQFSCPRWVGSPFCCCGLPSILFPWPFLFLYQYQIVWMTEALYYVLKSGNAILPTLFLFFKIALANHGCLYFQMNFCIILSMSENNVEIFIGIALNLYITSYNMDILMMLLCWSKNMVDLSIFPCHRLCLLNFF